MTSNQTPPDLAAILQTLAQHTQHTRQPSNPVTAPQQQIPYQQSTFSLPQTLQQAAAPQPVDPSKITTYPSALRYTTHLLISQPGLTSRVKKLIKSQHEHERQWWMGRDRVLVERRKRLDGRKAVDQVLRSLGGAVRQGNTGGGGTTGGGTGGGLEGEEESEEAALRVYDRKVHAACGMMVADVRKQLKEMGVPGFVIRGELVGEGRGQISKEQRAELEGKMLVLLEDLCKD